MSELVERLEKDILVSQDRELIVSRPPPSIQIEAAARIIELEKDFEVFKFSKRQTEERCSNLQNENARLITELSCARAAMAKEAANVIQKHIIGYGGEPTLRKRPDGDVQNLTYVGAILALADAPAGYVCVKGESDDDISKKA
jgi:hypothetical protein